MQLKKSALAGLAVLLAASLSPSSLATATSSLDARAAAKVGPVVSGASDAHEGPAFLDLRSATVRVKGQVVSVRLTTYEKWRTGWLLQCRDAILIVSWPDDQVQVNIDLRKGQRFRAVITALDAQNQVVGRVPAHHVRPRAVVFSFSVGKLQSSSGKWKAFSASPNDSGCKEQWYADYVPDKGYIVP